MKKFRQIKMVLFCALLTSGCGGGDSTTTKKTSPVETGQPPITGLHPTELKDFTLHVNVTGQMDKVDVYWLNKEKTEIYQLKSGSKTTLKHQIYSFIKPTVIDTPLFDCHPKLTKITDYEYNLDVNCVPELREITVRPKVMTNSVYYPVTLTSASGKIRGTAQSKNRYFTKNHIYNSFTFKQSAIDDSFPQIVSTGGPQECKLTKDGKFYSKVNMPYSFRFECTPYTLAFGKNENNNEELLIFSKDKVKPFNSENSITLEPDSSYYWLEDKIWFIAKDKSLYSIPVVNGKAGISVKHSIMPASLITNEGTLFALVTSNAGSELHLYKDGKWKSEPYKYSSLFAIGSFHKLGDNLELFLSPDTTNTQGGFKLLTISPDANISESTIPSAIKSLAAKPIFKYDNIELILGKDANDKVLLNLKGTDATEALSEKTIKAMTLWENKSGNQFLFYIENGARTVKQFKEKTTTEAEIAKVLKTKSFDWLDGNLNVLLAGVYTDNGNSKNQVKKLIYSTAQNNILSEVMKSESLFIKNTSDVVKGRSFLFYSEGNTMGKLIALVTPQINEMMSNATKNDLFNYDIMYTSPFHSILKNNTTQAMISYPVLPYLQ